MSSRFAIGSTNGRAQCSLAQSGDIDGRLKARLRWRRRVSAIARRCATARDAIRRHIVKFVEEQHHRKTRKR